MSEFIEPVIKHYTVPLKLETDTEKHGKECCKGVCENPAAYHLLIGTPVPDVLMSLGSCEDHILEAREIFQIITEHNITDECADRCEFAISVLPEKEEETMERVRKAIEGQHN